MVTVICCVVPQKVVAWGYERGGWYNQVHRHSAINYVTRAQRRAGLGSEKINEFMDNLLGTVYRAISIHLIHSARFSLKDVAVEAVTLIKRFGSALNLKRRRAVIKSFIIMKVSGDT